LPASLQYLEARLQVQVVDPEMALRSVFRVLPRNILEGQIDEVRDALPKSLRRLWEEAEDPTVLANDPLILTEGMEV
jgi:hypothetical protein